MPPLAAAPPPVSASFRFAIKAILEAVGHPVNGVFPHPTPNAFQEKFYWCTVTPIKRTGWPRKCWGHRCLWQSSVCVLAAHAQRGRLELFCHAICGRPSAGLPARACHSPQLGRTVQPLLRTSLGHRTQHRRWCNLDGCSSPVEHRASRPFDRADEAQRLPAQHRLPCSYLRPFDRTNRAANHGNLVGQRPPESARVPPAVWNLSWVGRADPLTWPIHQKSNT